MCKLKVDIIDNLNSNVKWMGETKYKRLLDVPKENELQSKRLVNEKSQSRYYVAVFEQSLKDVVFAEKILKIFNFEEIFIFC